MVWKIADTPCLVTDGNRCGERADRTASTAIWMVPSVPFLKPTGMERPGGEFAVDLALRRPGADGDPRGEIRDVLRQLRVEELAGGRQAQFRDIEQELPREAEALVDVIALVEVGVVDEALPADRRPRLLEIAPHDGDELVLVALRQRHEALGVLHRGLGVVNRAGSDDDDEARIPLGNHVGDGLPRVRHHIRGPFRRRQLLEQDGRWKQGAGLTDAEVVGPAEHGSRQITVAARRKPRNYFLSVFTSDASKVTATDGPPLADWSNVRVPAR